MNRAFVSCLALLLISACAPGARAPVSNAVRLPQIEFGKRAVDYQPNIDVFELPNGLRIALVPESGTNLVRVDVRYTVGAAEDPRAVEGLAHAVEHMSFLTRESAELPTVIERLRDVSLTHNAYTNWDETHYYATGFAPQLRELLEIERARMSASCEHIDPAAFERERQVVVQEIRQRSSATQRSVRRAIFGAKHPYAREVGGLESSVSTLRRAAVCHFLDRHYGPNRAVLVVSGAIDSARVRTMVRAIFGSVQTRATGTRAPLTVFAPSGKATTVDADVDEPSLLLTFRAPAWGTVTSVQHEMAMSLIQDALLSLVEDSPHIESVSVDLVGGYRGGATTVSLALRDLESADQALDAFSKARVLALERIDADYLRMIKSRRKGDLIHQVEHFQSRAQLVADYLQYRKAGIMSEALAEIGRLDGAQIARDARAWFGADKVRAIIIRPNKDAPAARRRVAVAQTADVHHIESVERDVDSDEAHRPLAVPDSTPRFAPKEIVLGNGLRVFLVPDLTHPSVQARLVFPIGYASDPPSKRGLARMAARMLEHDFERWYSPQVRSRISYILGLGGEFGAYVGERSTTFTMRGLAAHTDGLLWRLHWLLESGVYPFKSWMRLVRKSLESKPRTEKQQRWDRYAQVVMESLFGPGHPYATPTETAAVQRLQLADLGAFRRRHYQPRGAVLIVAGRFDARTVEAQVRRLWGAWKSGDAPVLPPSIPDARPVGKVRTLALADEEVAQPTALIAFPAKPGFRRQAAARTVLEHMLRKRLTGVRERLAATYSVSVDYRTSEGPGVLMISAQLDARKAGAALRSMREAVDSLRGETDAAFDADFARARRTALQLALASTIGAASIASDLAFRATYNLPADYSESVAREIATLTPAAVKALIAAELAPTSELVVLVAPDAQLETILRAAGLPVFRKVE